MSDYLAKKLKEVDDTAIEIVQHLNTKKVNPHLGMAACLKLFLSSAAVVAKSRSEYDRMIDHAISVMNDTRESYHEVVENKFDDFRKSFN